MPKRDRSERGRNGVVVRLDPRQRRLPGPRRPRPYPATSPGTGPSIPDPSTSLFTTSDGMYSFVMPATWTATPVPPNDAPDYGANLSRTAYSVRDAAGTEMALFMGGIPGDGSALPHPGHVLLDTEELPALTARSAEGRGPMSFVFDYFPDPGLRAMMSSLTFNG